MSRFDELMAAKNGATIVNNTTELTASLSAVFVLEDTIFTSLKIGGTDVKATYIQATGTAVKAGALIVPLNGASFSGVKLASGSVAAIREV